LFRKIIDLTTIIIFITAISLPLIFSDKKGGKPSEIEKRTLAPFPTIITEEGFIAPNINHGLRNWINDNAGFRIESKNISAYLEIRLFNMSQGRAVHIGKNGWYFYGGSHNIDIGKGDYFFSTVKLEKTLTNMERIYDFITNQGIAMVFVLVPSKASIYPEYIKGGDFVVQKTLIDQCTEYFSANSEMPIINLKDTLVDAKEVTPVYFRTDTHWNHEGEYVSYVKLIHELNQLGLIQSNVIAVTRKPSKRLGDLSAMMGLTTNAFAEPFSAIEIVSPQATMIESGEHYDQIVKTLGGNPKKAGYIYFENNNTEKKNALVLTDSFFMVGNMTRLLAEHVSSLDRMNLNAATPEIIAAIDPDFIILEITERSIYRLSNPDYLSP